MPLFSASVGFVWPLVCWYMHCAFLDQVVINRLSFLSQFLSQVGPVCQLLARVATYIMHRMQDFVLLHYSDALLCCVQKLRTQREANLKRKEENRRKSLVTQKISNPATLKRMLKSKKDRKKLMTADTLKSV